MYTKHTNDKVLVRRRQYHYITLRHTTSADGVLPKSFPYSARDRFPMCCPRASRKAAAIIAFAMHFGLSLIICHAMTVIVGIHISVIVPPCDFSSSCLELEESLLHLRWPARAFGERARPMHGCDLAALPSRRGPTAVSCLCVRGAYCVPATATSRARFARLNRRGLAFAPDRREATLLGS